MNYQIAANFVNEIFTKLLSRWQMVVFILFCILALLALMFKAFKKSFKIILFLTVGFGLILLVDFFVESADWTAFEYIDFAVRWGPTIVFAAVIVFSTWIGTLRGLRKSIVLLVQAFCAATVWLIFYFVTVNGDWFDTTSVMVANRILGENGLQELLHVSDDLTTLREILTEYIPTLFGENSQYGTILAENSAYIYTLVDMSFHIVVAVISQVFYIFTVFLLYIIYLIFYSERKYKRKRVKSFMENRTDSTYKKRRIGGGVIGFARGCIAAILILSFVGSAFFMIAGGKGDEDAPEHNFADENVGFVYDVYRSIDNYGSQGIFKVLNLISDPQDSPYYLFAADIVLSGQLDDIENELSQNIVFREEIGAFTGFARETYSLLMKYGQDKMDSVMDGASSNAFGDIVEVMKNPLFQTEFNQLIEEFDAQTYIINLSMSLASSIIGHIDEFAPTVSEDTRELAKIMFKKGYLSNVIPDERQAIEHGNDKSVRPYLNLNSLFNKNDTRIILNTVINLMSESSSLGDASSMSDDNNDSALTTLETVNKILPDIQSLSIFGDGKSGKINPVLGRMYCFLENRYLTAEGETGVNYKDIQNKNIQWTNEINVLIDVTKNVYRLSKEMSENETEVLNRFLSIFEDNNSNRNQNILLYNEICSSLVESKLLGAVLSTSLAYKALSDNLATALGESFYLSRSTVYENTYDDEGGLLNYGEMYYLLNGVRSCLDNSDGVKLLKTITSENEATMTELFELISAVITRVDVYGNTAADYMLESNLLRSALSSVLIGKANDYCYVPYASLEVDENGKRINIVRKEELRPLFEHSKDFIKYLDVNQDNYSEVLSDLLNDNVLLTLLNENRIFEGTVSKLISQQMPNLDFIVVPKALSENLEAWISVNGVPGELQNFISAFKLIDIDIKELVNGNIEKNDVVDAVLALSDESINKLFSSKILHYTVSDYLISAEIDMEGLSLVVPYSATQTLVDDVTDRLIKKSELILLFKQIALLGVSEDMDVSSVVVKLAVNKNLLINSNILSASVVSTVVNNGTLCDLLSLNGRFIKAGSSDELKKYNSSNPWQAELPNLIDALDEIFSLSSADESFIFDDESMEKSLNDLLRSLNDASFTRPSVNKLRVCYSSEIIRNKLTVSLDDILNDGIVDDTVINAAKDGAFYRYDEFQALSNALDLFEIDILGIDRDKLTQNVKSRLLTINDPLPEYDGKSVLDLVYPSVIITYMLTDELDKVLDGLVEQAVLLQIKGDSVRYPKNELCSFANAVLELGIDSVDSIDESYFDDISGFNDTANTDSNLTRLNVIYKSDIAAGIITKALKDAINESDSLIKEHSRAYKPNVHVYNESEIETLILLFGNVENVNDYADIDINLVKDCIYDDNQSTRSYLLTATVSSALIENSTLVIPSDTVESAGHGVCLLPKELALIIEFYQSVDDGQSNIDEWDVSTIKLPSEEQMEIICESKVMRATVTSVMRKQEDAVFVQRSNLDRSTNIDGNIIYILKSDEIRFLSAALNLCTQNGIFELPSFESTAVLGYDESDLSILFASDIVRYKVCDSVLSNFIIKSILQSQGLIESEIAFNLNSYVSATKDVVSAEAIQLVKEIIG